MSLKATRRRFLGLLPAAPLAGKAAADAAIAELSGVRANGLANNGGWISAVPSGKDGPSDGNLLKKAWQMPAFRGELESMLYEQNRRVGYLDPDIANKRSFSMAAKIAYQRQREVERSLQEWLDQGLWDRRRALMKRIRKFFLGDKL